MGDAQRRKKLGIPPTPRREKIARFTATLQGAVEQSYVAAKIFDSTTALEVTMQFHLYLINYKLYAEVAFPASEWSQYGWVGEHIDEISPLVSRLVFERNPLDVATIDSKKL